MDGGPFLSLAVAFEETEQFQVKELIYEQPDLGIRLLLYKNCYSASKENSVHM